MGALYTYSIGMFTAGWDFETLFLFYNVYFNSVAYIDLEKPHKRGGQLILSLLLFLILTLAVIVTQNFFIFFFLKIEFTGKVSSYNQSYNLYRIYI